MAYRQVYSMTHYSKRGERTESPEALSGLRKIKVLLFGVTIPKPINLMTPQYFGMSYSVLTVQSTDGILLECWQILNAKSKGTLILFHGYSGSKSSMLGESRAFYEMGYNVWLVDFRGSGGSSGWETTIGVREANDVESVYNFLNKNHPVKPLILYGHSLGSVAILRAISLYKIDPDAVILECPFNRMLDTVQNRFRAMKIPSFPCAQLLVFWGGLQIGFNGFQHNPEDYAKRVTCPTLLLQGNKDPRVTPEQAKEIFVNLKGRKKFQLLNNVGHESYFNADVKDWNHYVTDFLQDLELKR